ncbi:MAG: hydroxymethylglutaryl-CoA lyase [Schleiferiaceae bacterium]|nr:hydroxymethylglutaryl-CoA lyase [Schleiferiaceae bacterium]MDR9441792.1 hydroxymethylglutaryl-CoA lyase [Schleiferiaceae bacterium]
MPSPAPSLKLIECPRDAMQGLPDFVPTDQKIQYLSQLLKVGFDTIDAGSLVSPKVIPQMRDTPEVLEALPWQESSSKLLVIVANEQGGQRAAELPMVHYLGYPFSVSEVFQKRNTNKTIAESRTLVRDLLDIARENQKELVVYVSMGFGNPYREPWSADIVLRFCEKLADMGVRIISLSDTIGTSNPDSIKHLFERLVPAFPQIEFGAHLHTTPDSWREKVEAAFAAGCRRFDGAIQGLGGCPMADDDLVGNMPTEKLLRFAQENGLELGLDEKAFESAYQQAALLTSA